MSTAEGERRRGRETLKLLDDVKEKYVIELWEKFWDRRSWKQTCQTGPVTENHVIKNIILANDILACIRTFYIVKIFLQTGKRVF